jgi:hypothetical protein
MPMIEITTTKGALEGEVKRELAGRLSSLVLEVEAGPNVRFDDVEHMQALAWCFVREEDVFAGGKELAKPLYRIDVTLPEGAPGVSGPLASRGRAILVRRATEAVLDAEGSEMTMAEAHRVWVQIRFIPDGQWAGFGEVITVADLAEYGLGTGEPGGKADRMQRAALESMGAAAT